MSTSTMPTQVVFPAQAVMARRQSWIGYVVYSPGRIWSIRPLVDKELPAPDFGAVGPLPVPGEGEQAALVTLPALPPSQEEHEAAIWAALER